MTRPARRALQRERNPTVDRMIAELREEQASAREYVITFDTDSAPITFDAPVVFDKEVARPIEFNTDTTLSVPFAEAKPIEFRAKRVKRVIRRLLLPPMPKFTARGARWVLPAEELHAAYEEPNGSHWWNAGDGIDFDEAASWAAMDGCCDCDDTDDHMHSLVAVRIDKGETPLVLGDLTEPYVDDAVATEAWHSIRPMMVAVRERVLAESAAVLRTARPTSAVLARRVIGLADIDVAPGCYTGDDLAGIVLDHVSEPTVRGALADLVAIECPDLAGGVGAELERAMRSLEDRDVYIRHPEDLQYLILDRLHTPAAHGATGVALDGKYVVAETTYHSAFDEGRTEPFLIGWREATLVPVDDNWDLVEP